MAENLDQVVTARVEMIESLQTAIIQAGGRFFTYKELKTKTFEQLVRAFGQNNIRFVYGKDLLKNDDKKEDEDLPEAEVLTVGGVPIPSGFVEEK
jgi:hypothetical protein